MRSEPFIVDKVTGEPKLVSASATRYMAWKLIIKDYDTGKRKFKFYWTYKEAKETADQINERTGENVVAHVISRQMGYGPPYSRISDFQLLEINENGKLWCPYCRKLRKFNWLPRMEGNVCEFCHTRDTDFHVKRNNPIMWEPDRLKGLLEQRSLRAESI